MGWCHEFGVEIDARCGHPMAAGLDSCSCPDCGTVCPGRFEGGCESVWARGPRLAAPARPATYSPSPALALAGPIGAGPDVGAELEGERHLHDLQVEVVPGASSSEVVTLVTNGSARPDRRAPGLSASDRRGEAGPVQAADAVELERRLARVEDALTALTGQIDRFATLSASTVADRPHLYGGEGPESGTRDLRASGPQLRPGSQEVPLAVRAARALLADARKRAAVAQIERMPEYGHAF